MAAKDISKTLVLKDGVTATLKKAIGGTVEYKRHLRDLQQVGSRAWGAIKTGAAAAAAAVGAAATAMAGIGIKANAGLETAEQSFGILLNSGEAAKQMVSDLQRLAESSPFEFAGLQQSAKTLLGMGFTGQQVIPILQRLGDAVAATGGNTEQLEGIALALGQIQAKGKLSAEEVNQLAERGIPVWQMLSKEMGKTPAELMKLAEQGKLLSGQVLPLLFTGLEKRFGGAMQKMSDTFEYTVANIKETGTRHLAEITKPLFASIKEDMKGVQAFLASDRAVEWGARFASALSGVYNGAKAVANTIWTIGSFVANNWSIIGPVVYGIVGALGAYKLALIGINTWKKIVTAATWAWNAALRMTPLGWVSLAIGAVITAGVYLINNWEQVKRTGASVWNAVVDAAEWGVNKLIDGANFVLRAFNYAWEAIKFGAAYMWNGIVSLAEQGVQSMLRPLNAVLEAMGKSRIEVNFGGAKFANVEAPTWDSAFSPIQKVDFGRAKVSTASDEIAQARKEQNEARKMRAQQEQKLLDALNNNTKALTFNTDATAGNTAATEKNTKAQLRDNQSPMDLADSLLARIERHVWGAT